MKAIRKITLVTLILGLIAAGVSLAMGAYKRENWMDVSKKIRVAQGYYAEKITFTNNELGIFNNIDIDSNHSVTIKTGDIAAPELLYDDAYSEQTEVSVTDGKLIIRSKTFENKLFGGNWLVFSLNYESPQIVLTLPVGYVIDNLYATAISEKVLVDGINVTGEIKVESISDSVTAKNLQADSIVVSSTGDSCYAENVKADSLTAKSTSGWVEIKNAEIVNTIDAYSSSDRVTISNSKANIIKAKSISARVEINDVDIADTIDANSSSDRVTINNSKANIIKAKSISASVKTESCDAYIYELNSISGKVEMIATGDINDYKFYLSTTAGKCQINGDSKGKKYDTTETDANKPRFITAKSTSSNVYIKISL